MHALLRGLDKSSAQTAEEVARGVWEARTGANRVEVAPLRSSANGVAYLALHHLKPAQHAPEGWTGRRLRPSKGWWGADSKQLRTLAREAVRDRAHEYRVREDRKATVADLVEQGCDVEMATDLVWGLADEPVATPPRATGAQVVRLKRLEVAA